MMKANQQIYIQMNGDYSLLLPLACQEL